MSVITIPKQLAQKDDLVVIPKSEYLEFLRLRGLIKEVKPTKVELKAIERGRRAITRGDFVTLDALKKELGF